MLTGIEKKIHQQISLDPLCPPATPPVLCSRVQWSLHKISIHCLQILLPFSLSHSRQAFVPIIPPRLLLDFASTLLSLPVYFHAHHTPWLLTVFDVVHDPILHQYFLHLVPRHLSPSSSYLTGESSFDFFVGFSSSCQLLTVEMLRLQSLSCFFPNLWL